MTLQEFWTMENNLLEEWKKIMSVKDRELLYELADKSKIAKDWACHELITRDFSTNEDLMKVIKRSPKYREAALYTLIKKNKYTGNITDEQIEILIDKFPYNNWVRGLKKNGQ